MAWMEKGLAGRQSSREAKKRGGDGRGGSVSGVETASVDVAGSRGAPGVAWQLRQTWTGAEAQEASAEPDKGQQMKALLCRDEEKQRSAGKVKTHKHTQKHTRRCSEIQKHPCKRLLKLFSCHYQVPSSPKGELRKLKIEL